MKKKIVENKIYMLCNHRQVSQETLEHTRGHRQKEIKFLTVIRRVWGYQRGNQNPYIEEEQTTQWPKEKLQKDKQRSTKHTNKTKDRVTWTPLKTGGELRCSGRVSSYKWYNIA